MHSTLRKLTPSAPATVHLFLAGLLWTLVGAFLTYRGVSALKDAPANVMAGVLALAAGIGYLKGTKVIRPTALKGVRRILERGDGKCVGGFLSWQSWGFVLFMMALGKYLRSANLPGWVLGLILPAVGLALFIGCLTFWKAWWDRVRG